MHSEDVNVELLSVPDCPNVAATRDLLRAVLADLGLSVGVVERVGEYPSPTVLVNGNDVTGAPTTAGIGSCRIDLPTAGQIKHALRAAVQH
jgi:hypothetical protein